MLIARKVISLIVIGAYLGAGSASGTQYLAPSSAVHKKKTLDEFSEAVALKTSMKDRAKIPVRVLKDDQMHIEYVTEEYLNRLKSENKVATLVERIATDPDTGEETPEEEYARDDVIAYLLKYDLVTKAFINPKACKYVSRIIEKELLDIGWAQYALMNKEGKGSFDGDAVLVLRDGLEDIDLRRGARMYTVLSLIKYFDTREADEIIRSAFEIADAQYGDTVTREGQFLMDDALDLATIVTVPIDVKVGPELTAAALLFAVEKNSVPAEKITAVPDIIWSWIRTFQELNRLKFAPPLTKKRKLIEMYMQNFKGYLTKRAGDTVQPLLLLMAYRMNQFLFAREEMGRDFYDRYHLSMSIYTMLAEQLGLKHFSDSMKNLSYRKVHEKQHRAILRQFNKVFGVYYKDLSVLADVFHAQISKEIRELGERLGRKIEAEVIFGVKDPSSIDEKIAYYAKTHRISHKNPLDGIADLPDLVRGKIIVKNEADLTLMRQLPFAQKISPGEELRATAIARKVSGVVPPIEDLIDENTLREATLAHVPPNTLKNALARLAHARSAGKTKLRIEVQMQTPEMRRKEFTGTVLHSFYNLRKLGYDMYASHVVYDTTTDLAKRMRAINSEPHIVHSEFVAYRYHIPGRKKENKVFEFIHGVPRSLYDTEDARPAVIDIIVRRDIWILRKYLLRPLNFFINGKPVKDFGEKITTGDIVEIRPGSPDPVLQKRIDDIIQYIEGKGSQDAAYRALPAGNMQSRVAVTLLLENISDREIMKICAVQLDLLKHRIASDSYMRVMPEDDDIRSNLEFYNMIHWGFRRSNLLEECCLAMHFGFVDLDTAVSAVFSGRGLKILQDAGMEIPLEKNVLEALSPLGLFSARMPEKDMAAKVMVEIGKGNVSVQDITKLLTKPSLPPAPVVPVLSETIQTENAA